MDTSKPSVISRYLTRKRKKEKKHDLTTKSITNIALSIFPEMILGV